MGVDLWLFGQLISIVPLDKRFAAPAAGKGPTAARRHTKMLRKQHIIIMGVDFGIIWAADFDNAIIYKVRRPAAGQGSPAARKNDKKQTIYHYWCRF